MSSKTPLLYDSNPNLIEDSMQKHDEDPKLNFSHVHYIVKDPKLNFSWASLASIESANLTIKSGEGDTQKRIEVYGKILVTRDYKVEEDRAEEVTEGISHNLTLSGPKYSLDHNHTDYMHVRLYEKGSGRPVLEADSCFAGRGSPICLKNERTTLVVTFTRFDHAMPFDIRISTPIREAAQSPWTIYGDVSAVQTVSTCFKRTFVLFHRTAQNGVQVSPGERIPLDRSLVVSPVQKEDISGPSLTIEVNLCFVQNGDEYVNHLLGEKSFIFCWYESLKRYPINDTIPLKPHKRKYSNIDNDNSALESLNISVCPVIDCFELLDDEEDGWDYESQMKEGIPWYPGDEAYFARFSS